MKNNENKQFPNIQKNAVILNCTFNYLAHLIVAEVQFLNKKTLLTSHLKPALWRYGQQQWAEQIGAICRRNNEE